MVKRASVEVANRKNPESRAKMRDVAALARVSIQTVSNFVNGRHDEMSAETRDRVAKAMRALRYRTNVAAASLRSQRMRTIAFLVLDQHAAFLADPLTDQLIAGVGDVARDKLYSVLIQSAQPGEHDVDFFSALRDGRVDGAVIQLSGKRSIRREYLEEARSLGLPIVVIDEEGLPPGLLSVRAEQKHGARVLTDHLIQTGHRRIAFIGAQIPWAVVEQRVAGYRASLRASSIPVDANYLLLKAGYKALAGEELATFLLTRNRSSRPTAIICGSDLLAAGAMSAAKSLGLSIPKDVAIAGFNDFEFSAYLDPPLTTVRVPAYEMGVRAATSLIAVLQEEEVDLTPQLFPTEMVLRGSA